MTTTEKPKGDQCGRAPHWRHRPMSSRLPRPELEAGPPTSARAATATVKSMQIQKCRALRLRHLTIKSCTVEASVFREWPQETCRLHQFTLMQRFNFITPSRIE